ncbi:MAG: L-2-hydroxyglutarate oxidase [Sphingobacteriales bacterium]|jgi:L-2-hydroxyglutarate oxidase|nr:L-2-hydroxyglutarate oxidase [Sphingobacteriales bacterium]
MQNDVVIIGGGIVGLASAWNILKQNPGLKVAILEKEAQLAAHQTGHNSGVIHSGIYYKPGSLKAQNCIGGYHMLLDFCREHGIMFDLCGKLIVATDAWELPLLDNLYKRGLENRLDKISMVEQERLKEFEPHMRGIRAIHVPYTGIIDYTDVSLKLAELIEQMGGRIYTSQQAKDIRVKTDGVEVVTDYGVHSAKLMVNCAGLYCDKIAEMAGEKPDTRIIPFRGEYFMLKPEKRGLVRNLIYPVPDPNFPFLGVHFTRMIDGGIEAGPNAVFAFKREGYEKADVDLVELFESLTWPGFQKVATKFWKTGMGEFYRSFSKTAFTKALQKFIPEVQEDDLVPAEAGVRAQACDRTGGLLDDFKIIENNRAIHILNAPSPAATSSLSIGQTIASLTLKHL